METAIPSFIIDCVRSLPPLPAAVQRLLTLARDKSADFRQVAGIIATDPTLTARTLRAANSAMYGLPRRVQTISQAIVLLGRDAVVSIAVGASVLGLQQRLRHRWPTDPAYFWRHSLGVALTARTLARQLHTADPEEAFVAGLLHDIGKLILLEHFGEVYGQVLMAAQYGTDTLHALERTILCVDHAMAGEALAMHWNLPDALTRAIAGHHEGAPAPRDSVADLVRDANELIKTIHLGDAGNRHVELKPGALRPHGHLDPEMLREHVITLPAAVAEAESALAGTPSALTFPTDPERRPSLHVHLTQPEERDVVVLMALAAGYEPVLLNEAPEPGSDLHPAGPLAGVVTDVPLDPAREVAYREYNVPVADFARWRDEHAQPTAQGYLNAHALRAWLEACFTDTLAHHACYA